MRTTDDWVFFDIFIGRSDSPKILIGSHFRRRLRHTISDGVELGPLGCRSLNAIVIPASAAVQTRSKSWQLAAPSSSAALRTRSKSQTPSPPPRTSPPPADTPTARKSTSPRGPPLLPRPGAVDRLRPSGEGETTADLRGRERRDNSMRQCNVTIAQ